MDSEAVLLLFLCSTYLYRTRTTDRPRTLDLFLGANGGRTSMPWCLKGDGPTLIRGSFRLLLTSVHFSLFQVPGRSGLWWSGAVVLDHQKVLDQRRSRTERGLTYG